MTSLMFCVTSVKARSSLRPWAGMTAQEKTWNVPAGSPVVPAAAPGTRRRRARCGRSAWLVAMVPDGSPGRSRSVAQARGSLRVGVRGRVTVLG
ncbi:hypothetical protein [Streptomyces sp. NPDC092903]|uniref:hypothetical protein n=1 Tax=Streptomyces sp. NPDC092903 TaxID=3366017 RepID=UPI003812E635